MNTALTARDEKKLSKKKELFNTPCGALKRTVPFLWEETVSSGMVWRCGWSWMNALISISSQHSFGLRGHLLPLRRATRGSMNNPQFILMFQNSGRERHNAPLTPVNLGSYAYPHLDCPGGKNPFGMLTHNGGLCLCRTMTWVTCTTGH